MMKSVSPIFLVALAAFILLLGACEEEIPGCTNPSSPNFNPLANRDDGSCTYTTPDSYHFLRGERNTVSYTLSFSRQLRVARFARLLQSFGEPSGYYQDPSPIVFGYPDTLELAALDVSQLTSAALPATLGSLASGDILAGQFRDHSPLPALNNLFSDAFDYIEAQANAGRIGSSAVYTSPDGVDYARLLPPLLAGACLYRPAVDSLLLAIDTLDNITLSGGVTRAERSWDLAFGSWGLPASGASWYDGTLPYSDLDLNDTLELDSEYVYSYAMLALDRARNQPDIRFAEDIFRYFREGRAAIAFGPERVPDASLAAVDIRSTWEKVIAATVIHHMNGAVAELETVPLDTIAYRAEWSAAYGHAFTLGMRQDGTMSPAQISAWLDALGDAPRFTAAYPTELRTLRNSLGSLFGFSPEQAESF